LLFRSVNISVGVAVFTPLIDIRNISFDIVRLEHGLYTLFQLRSVIRCNLEYYTAQCKYCNQIADCHEHQEHVRCCPCSYYIHYGTDEHHDDNKCLEYEEYAFVFFNIIQVTLTVEEVPEYRAVGKEQNDNGNESSPEGTDL